VSFIHWITDNAQTFFAKTSCLATIDWIIIVAYMLFSLAVGVIMARRAMSNTTEFFASGRSLPWWLAGTSMVATSFASDTPLIITGWVRNHGIQHNWLWWVFAAGGMLSVFLMARLWRRAGVLTDVEFTELRYSGHSAAVLRGFRAAYLALPITCITMAWVILAIVKLLGVLFGVDPLVAVVISILIATFYATLSGFWGVVITDLVQFVIAVIAAIAMAVFSVNHFGSMQELIAQATAASHLGSDVIGFFPPTHTQTEWWRGPLFAFAVLVSIQWWANKNADGGGIIVQRMVSARTETDALLATLWFNIINYALRPWPWIIVAVASIAVFPNMEDPEAAYPAMIKQFAGPGWLGLILTAFIASFMSTINTHANLSASYIVNDFYRRFVHRDASERTYVIVSQIASVLLMIISAVLAITVKSLNDLFLFMLAFSSGVGLVYILRWFWWRVNAWSEISAMIASSAIAIPLSIFKSKLNLEYPHILLITVAGSTIVWVIVTFLTPAVSHDRLVAFYRRVRPYGFWGPVAAAAPDITPPAGFSRQIVNWIAATVMVIAATIGTGKLFFGDTRSVVICFTLTAISIAIIAKETRRTT